MVAYLLAPSLRNGGADAIEPKLKELLPGLSRIETMDQITRDIVRRKNGKIVVIFYSTSVSNEIIDNLVQVAARYKEQVFFILLSNDISATDYKRLVNSGGADWVSASGSFLELPELVARHERSSDSQPTSEAVRRPTIVSFLPCLGGVGNTTIAVEVALHVKRSKQSSNLRVCYFDLDFQTSHVSDLLDSEPRLQIEEILQHPERLDDQLFEQFLNHHAAGLDVLANVRSRLDPCEISLSTLDALLEKIVTRYDFIVLDHPVFWLNWTVPALEHSDLIVMTAVNSVPCLRQLRATMDAVLSVKSSIAKTAVVINRAQDAMFGRIKHRQHVERIVPDERVFYVRDDKHTIERANQGKPAALGGPSRYPKDFKALGEFCVAIHRRERVQVAP
jgi:Flp pilus assembly CpaE family ATPase